MIVGCRLPIPESSLKNMMGLRRLRALSQTRMPGPHPARQVSDSVDVRRPDYQRIDIVHCVAIMGLSAGGSQMTYLWNLWDDESDPLGNVQHIAEHGLTTDEVEAVLNAPDSTGRSELSQRPCVFGFTPAGEYIIVIFEPVDEDSVYPITAYHVPEP